MKKAVLLVLVLLLAGCGYSTRSLLPSRFRTIYIEPFENKVDYMNTTERKLYIPGMETRVREAVVDRYLFDGNLRIGNKDTADLVLKGQLLSFEREQLSLQPNESVQEYRLRVTVALELVDSVEKQPMWKETAFAGEATYYTVGPLAKPEAQAIDEAIKDLALRVVARTVEAW